MKQSVFWLAGMRHLLSHPWQLMLSVLGIAVGVAVVVAIDLTNHSAMNAFTLSMESVSGRATHYIGSATGTVPDSVFRILKVDLGIPECAPVIERYVKSDLENDPVLLVLGIDPYSEAPFRPYTSRVSITGESNFMTAPGVVMVSGSTAGRYGLRPGDRFRFRNGPQWAVAQVGGLIQAKDERSTRALDNILVADIAVAQDLLGIRRGVSRIDLRLPEGASGDSLVSLVKRHLPDGLALQAAGARADANMQMTRAFRLNLTALSLLALIVGIFLIYNTITFSVVQRRSHIGLMRCLGVTRKEIFRTILNESLWLGMAGTVIGILLGILLARGLVSMVIQTINDLYLVLAIKELNISLLTLAKGALIGPAATLLAAIIPAREATRTVPRGVLHRSREESRLQHNLGKLTLAGILLGAVGALIMLIPSGNIAISYFGILLVLMGFALLAPTIIRMIVGILTPLCAAIWGSVGRMAARSITAHLSRTAVAIAALSIAVSATVGIGTMVSSFRETVVHWLETRLDSDIYISPPSLVSRRSDALLPADFVDRLYEQENISAFNYFREIRIEAADSFITLIATHIEARSYDSFPFKAGNPAQIWPAFTAGEAVLVSEPFAYRNQLAVGDVMHLATEAGKRRFPIAGIYYDYGSDLGMVVLDFDAYQRYWSDHRLSGISVMVKPGRKPDAIIDELRGLAGPQEEILVRSNRFLRETSIAVFDRTFAITHVLHLLSIGVAFIGVLSALMALLLERSREMGILRATGLTPRDVWRLTMLQTGIMGGIAGVLALPLGHVLALILVNVVNLRSFGWTLQVEWMPGVMLQALAIAIIAALLAGLYPARRMSRMSPALVLREE